MIGVNPAILALHGGGAGAGGGGAVTLVSPDALAAAVAFARASPGTALGADGATWAEIAANAPRFHGAARRLLVEGTRTNLNANPRTPGGTGWTNTGLASVAPLPGPDGTTASAFLVTENTTTGGHNSFPPSAAFTAGQSYAFAGLFQAGTCTTVQIVAGNTRFGVQAYGNFDLANGAVGTAGTAVTRHAIRAMGGGWYWCEIAAPALSTGSTGAFTFAMTTSASAARLPSYAGTGRTLGVSWCWAEAGAFATTPILPPAGSPGPATRNADAASWTLPAGYPAQGTALVRAMVPQAAPAGLDQGLFQLDDGTDSNRIVLRNAAGGSTVVAVIVSGGATLATLSGGATAPGTAFRAALAWGPAGCALCLSGGTVVSTATAPPAGLTRLLIGHAAAALNRALNGEVEILTVQPARLSNAEVGALANAP